jgi:fumarate hydratase subunit alpha
MGTASALKQTRRNFLKTVGVVTGGLVVSGSLRVPKAISAESSAESFADYFYDSLVKGVTSISPDVLKLLQDARSQEDASGRAMIDALLKNVAISQSKKSGICQSPGIPYVRIRCGPDMTGIDYASIIGSSVVRATKEGYLRPSIVHPLTRKNTGNNSGPGIPNFDYTLDPKLDHVEVIVSFKGCGAEWGNAYRTFDTETLGKNLVGMKRFVLETVINSGGKPCPPIGLGIGIGGQMDVAAKLSRVAISTRKWDDRNPDPQLDRLEQDFKAAINQLGIGPAGAGGKTSALAVKIGMAYTHTAICPVAVNFHCWTARRFGYKWNKDGLMEVTL